ncbi:WxcM-like domain-containing protein, partial [Escherichia coli]|uniref:WxcM-like domain-containing protein n=1 Tax=Escherichia coli TaxID=562 RepID=UPI0025A1FB66
GYHAHRKLKQMAICVKGYCTFTLDDGFERRSIKLDNPAQGLLIESFLWREMSDFSEDCVLLVLADADYDELDYIREYETFKKIVRGIT